MQRHYRVLTQADVDIGYAGSQPPEAPLHRYIAELKPGDPLQLRPYYERWELADSLGRPVGHLAKAWQPPAGMVCCDIRVWAILRRTKAQTQEEYLARIRCDAWEVVLPEMVFQPAVG